MKPAWTRALSTDDVAPSDVDRPPSAGSYRRWYLVAAAAAAVIAVVLAVRFLTGGAGDLRVSDAVVGANDADVVAAYLVIDNPGPEDRLISASSPDADEVTLHSTVTDGGLSTMEGAGSMVVPADGELRLDPGGSHLMIEGTDEAVTVGSTIRLHLEFERSGGRDVVARAVPLAELPERLPR